jgi:hypothetical protein
MLLCVGTGSDKARVHNEGFVPEGSLVQKSILNCERPVDLFLKAEEEEENKE